MKELDYDEALKLVKERDKPEDNYLLIKFGYSRAYLFPHKQGMEVIEALNKGKVFQVCNYSDSPPEIRDITQDDVTIMPVTSQQRQDALVAQLLNIPIKLLNGQREKTTSI